MKSKRLSAISNCREKGIFVVIERIIIARTCNRDYIKPILHQIWNRLQIDISSTHDAVAFLLINSLFGRLMIPRTGFHLNKDYSALQLRNNIDLISIANFPVAFSNRVSLLYEIFNGYLFSLFTPLIVVETSRFIVCACQPYSILVFQWSLKRP